MALRRTPEFVTDSHRIPHARLAVSSHGHPRRHQHIYFIPVRDTSWHLWETAAYEVFARELTKRGAAVLSYNGHLQTTGPMIDAVVAVAGPLRLRAQGRLEPALSDPEAVSAQLVDTHEDLVVPRYPARTLDVVVPDVAGLVAEHSRIAGSPTLVFVARLPERLAAAYIWDDASGFSTEQVLTGIRLIETVEDGPAIVWIPTDIEALPRVLADWGDRGPKLAVVAASCLADPWFQSEGLHRLQALMPVTILVDVPPDRLVASWTRHNAGISYVNIRVDDAQGEWWAIAFTAVDESLLWFVVGTEATVGLFRQGLEQAANSTLRLAEEWSEVLQAALTTTLAFETTLDFRGVEART